MARVFKEITEEQYLSLGDIGIKVAFDWAGGGWSFTPMEDLLKLTDESFIWRREYYHASKANGRQLVFYVAVDQEEDCGDQSN